ncbi:hypothetical protein HY570_02945 [Candidatus Micrarchaeota archaeon]|nr:hypothetical protein [Candidatus Micrarchaeota archaeon]
MRKAFFFMLDAFTALYIMLISISLLLFLVNVPKSLHKQYQEVYDINRDSLTTLDSLKMRDIWSTPLRSSITADERDMENSILEQMAKHSLSSPSQPGFANALAQSFLDSGDSPMIPINYEYELSIFSLKENRWIVIASRNSQSDRVLQTVDYRIIQGYSVHVDPGRNPFGYRSCQGNATPCDAPISLFNEGSLIGPTLVKLMVWV